MAHYDADGAGAIHTIRTAVIPEQKMLRHALMTGLGMLHCRANDIFGNGWQPRAIRRVGGKTIQLPLCDLHSCSVSQGREDALLALGAEVVRVAGNYDAAVHQCALGSEDNGWFVVSDTSYDGYEDVPRNVMEGYSLVASEIIDQMNSKVPTHVFVQGGVGGIAAAICGTFWLNGVEQRPRFIVVEPELVACIFESARNGKLTNVDISDETLMAGLSCGEVPKIAWKVLKDDVSDFFTIPEDLVAPTMRLLARREFGDQAIVAGESAIAGLAAFIASPQSENLSNALGITKESIIVVIGTEGATDPEIYNSLVGRNVGTVARNYPPDLFIREILGTAYVISYAAVQSPLKKQDFIKIYFFKQPYFVPSERWFAA